MACSTISALPINSCYALNENTHAELNEKIARGAYDSFSLDAYIKNNLGIVEGVQKEYSNIEIWKWIRLGGWYEDKAGISYARSLNHFHDPLKDWNSAGYSGPLAKLDPYPIKSSILWAQAPEQYFGDYSWVNARDYFYKALTARNNADRENNFADTFRAVGQVMHLVEDASVPAHTRNDGHVVYNYEKWVLDVQEKNSVLFNQLINNSTITVDKSLFTTSVDPAATRPIAGLFDSNKYNGSNPDVTTGPVGLAEYTNANFLSEGTRFEDYPYPSWDSVERMYIQIPDPEDPTKTVYRPYYTKARDGDASFYLLATVGYLSDYVHTHFPELDYEIRKNEKPALDEFCYDNYARKLLPRAVAYSSALLEYFFRGQLEVTDAETEKDNDGNINAIKLKAKNTTPDEAMLGKFLVSYQYKKKDETDYSYGVSEPVDGVALSSSEGAAPQEFRLGFEAGEEIPADAEKIEYMLVYRGKLGAEEDAVAGKSFKADVLVIDDWENGQNWSTEDQRVTLDLSAPGHDNSAAALKLYVVSGSASYAVFTNDAFSDGRATVTVDGRYYSVGGALGRAYWYNGLYFDVLKAGQRLLPLGGQVIDSISCDLDWWALMDRSDGITGVLYSFTFDVKAEIYEDTGPGSLPGTLVATSETETVGGISALSTNGWDWGKGYLNDVTLTFPDGVALEEGRYYNILLSSSNPACFHAPSSWDYGVSFVFTGIRNSDVVSGNYFYYAEGWSKWIDFPNSDLTAFSINVRDVIPIAQRAISTDCSDKTRLKLAVKSALTGNMIDLVYGTDEDHTVEVPLNSTTKDWEVHEVTISDGMDKSKLGCFAIKFGKDAFDSDGKTKENTIYIDDLVAE